MLDGSPMEPKLAAALMTSNPLPADIFDQFFTDDRKTSRVTFILNTSAGVIVACSEEVPGTDIQPDCTGMPTLHLFLITMSGLNVRAITHLATTQTVYTRDFSIWTE
jgi:hypothetical protein